jgi:predicted Zn-dependent peptidase
MRRAFDRVSVWGVPPNSKKRGTALTRERRRVRAAGPILAVCLTLACLAAAFGGEGDLTTFELDNGLTIHVYEKHAVPVAAVQVWYDTGAIKEYPGIRGLSHLFEHMMFLGSRKFGPEEHGQLITEVGGSSNAYTSSDVTVYHEVVPASALELVFELEADRMGWLTLETETFENEREVVKEEYRQNYENNPFGRMFLDLQAQVFGDHPYSWGAIGVMSDLDSLEIDDCRAYYESHYAPDQASLVVAGDVEPAEVLELAERHFGSIGPSSVVTPYPDAPVWKGPGRVSVKADLPVPVSGVGYFLPPSGDDDCLPLQVLVNRLSDHLEKTLVAERGVCVYAQAVHEEMRQTSIVGFVGAHFPNVPASDVIAAIDEEISTYLSDVLSERELAGPRNTALLDERLGRYSANTLAHGIGHAIELEYDASRFLSRADRIKNLTARDLSGVAERHLVPENRAEILIEPARPSLFVGIAGRILSLFR